MTTKFQFPSCICDQPSSATGPQYPLCSAPSVRRAVHGNDDGDGDGGDEIFLPLENRAVAHHNPERTVSQSSSSRPTARTFNPTIIHESPGAFCVEMATMTATSAVAPVKHQVVDKLPKRLRNLKFGIQSNQDIVNQGVLEVSDRSMYDIDKGREPTQNGVLDKRLVSTALRLEDSAWPHLLTSCCARELPVRPGFALHATRDWLIASGISATFGSLSRLSTSATSSSPLPSYKIYARIARGFY